MDQGQGNFVDEVIFARSWVTMALLTIMIPSRIACS